MRKKFFEYPSVIIQKFDSSICVTESTVEESGYKRVKRSLEEMNLNQEPKTVKWMFQN